MAGKRRMPERLFQRLAKKQAGFPLGARMGQAEENVGIIFLADFKAEKRGTGK